MRITEKIDKYLNEEGEEPKIYFGHPRLFYNTPEEKKSMKMIYKEFPGYIILSPNQGNRFQRSVEKGGFSIFYRLIDRCKIGVFMTLDDGRWGRGIYREALYAEEQNKDIYEVNPWKNYISPIKSMKNITPISKDDPYYKKFTLEKD